MPKQKKCQWNSKWLAKRLRDERNVREAEAGQGSGREKGEGVRSGLFDLFLGLRLDVVGEPALQTVSNTISGRTGIKTTYQTLKQSFTGGRATWHDIPYPVSELRKLKLLSNLLWAHGCEVKRIGQ